MENKMIYSASAVNPVFVEGYKTATQLQRGVFVSNGPVDVTEVIQLSVNSLDVNEINDILGRIGNLNIGKQITVLNKDGGLIGFYYLGKNGTWKSSATLN